MSVSDAKPIHEYRQPRRWPRWTLLGLVVVVLIATTSFLFYAWSATSKALDGAAEPQTISIAEGSGTTAIGDQLVDENIVSSARIFSLAVLLSGARGELKAGTYELSASQSPMDIVDVLRGGDTKEVRVTIPEGLRLDEVADLIEESGLTTSSEFMKAATDSNRYKNVFLTSVPAGDSLEGFLFPDTYRFAHDATAEDIVKKMLDNFEQQIGSLLTQIDDSNFDLFEIIILASIVEGEVPFQDDRPIVAGLFINRLELGMLLQADSTLAYITQEDRIDFTLEDIAIDDPYNTYQNTGLPPGPINSPGLQAIQAVLDPTETDFLYFVSNPETSETLFAETLDEHNQNIEKVL